MRISVLFFISALFFASCNGQNPSIKNLDANSFEQGINRDSVQIIDVRTPEEYKAKHIAKAKNIDVNGNDFERQMNGLDKTKPIYIYCLAGSRSKKASDWAAKNGFNEIYNFDGGINAWLAANKPVVTENGEAPPAGMSFDEYLDYLKKSDKLVLVDFNALWCGPCKVLKPTVLKVTKDNEKVVQLYDIDVDKNPLIARTMNIKAIPLLVLYKHGKEVWRNLGLTDEDTITEKVKEFSK